MPQYTNVTDGRISYGIGLDLTVGQKHMESIYIKCVILN